MSYHNRLQHHFRVPAGEFTQIANDLIRDSSISSDAYRVMSLLMSHDPNSFYESVNSIAKRYGWTWRAASRAIEDLAACRMLVVRPHVNGEGRTLFETWIVNPFQFSETDAGQLGQRVVLLNHTGGSAESQKGFCENTKGSSAESQNIEHQENTNKEEKLEATALIEKIIPHTHPHPVRSALEKKAAQLLDGGAKAWSVEAGLTEWLVRSGAGIGLLPSLVSDALKAGPTDPLAQLREAYDTGEISKLAERGLIYTPPEDEPDGLDVAGLRAWNLTKKREWLGQLIEEMAE